MFVGVDVGKAHIRVALSAGQPEPEHYCKESYRRGSPADVERHVCDVIGKAIETNAVREDALSGIGLAVPAVVNRSDGSVIRGPDFDFMSGRSITRPIEARFAVPVTADVDTVMAT